MIPKFDFDIPILVLSDEDLLELDGKIKAHKLAIAESQPDGYGKRTPTAAQIHWHRVFQESQTQKLTKMHRKVIAELARRTEPDAPKVVHETVKLTGSAIVQLKEPNKILTIETPPAPKPKPKRETGVKMVYPAEIQQINIPVQLQVADLPNWAQKLITSLRWENGAGRKTIGDLRKEIEALKNRKPEAPKRAPVLKSPVPEQYLLAMAFMTICQKILVPTHYRRLLDAAVDRRNAETGRAASLVSSNDTVQGGKSG